MFEKLNDLDDFYISDFHTNNLFIKIFLHGVHNVTMYKELAAQNHQLLKIIIWF